MRSEIKDVEKARALLAKSPWLSSFSPDLRDKFLAKTRLLPPFERGQRVYHAGDKPDGIYGVVSGYLGFEIAVDEDGPNLAHHLRPGNWFGELAHILNNPRRISIYAIEPSQCIRIGARELTSLLKTEPLLWKHLAIMLGEGCVLALNVIHDLLQRVPRKRMASTLLRLAGLRYQEQQGDQPLILKLTHEQLAHMSNLSRGSVAQALNELEQLGYLKYTYGHVHLLDPEGLRAWLKG